MPDHRKLTQDELCADAPAPEPLTPAQAEAAQQLARETLKADHLAVERYARTVIPDA